MYPHQIRDANRREEGRTLRVAGRTTNIVADAGGVSARQARNWVSGRAPSPLSRVADMIRRLAEREGASPWPLLTMLRVVAYETEVRAMTAAELVGSFWQLLDEAVAQAGRFMVAVGKYSAGGKLEDLEQAATELSTATAEFVARCRAARRKPVDPRDKEAGR
jgi:hypothetical protein